MCLDLCYVHMCLDLCYLHTTSDMHMRLALCYVLRATVCRALVLRTSFVHMCLDLRYVPTTCYRMPCFSSCLALLQSDGMSML